MRRDEFASLRTWEREEAYRRGGRRLLFALILLSAIGLGLLYLLLDAVKKENLENALYYLQRDAEEVAAGAEIYFPDRYGAALDLAAHFDSLLQSGRGDAELSELAQSFLRGRRDDTVVWFVHPETEAGERKTQLYTLERGKAQAAGARDKTAVWLDDAWLSIIFSRSGPSVGGMQLLKQARGRFAAESLVFSFGCPTKDGRAAIGFESAIPMKTLMEEALAIPLPGVILFSETGLYFGLRWSEPFAGDGPGSVSPEVTAAQDIMLHHANERWGVYDGLVGGESLVYCYPLRMPAGAEGWTLVLTTPAAWIYGQNQEAIVVLFAVWQVLLILIFVVVWLVRRRRYNAPVKRTEAAAPENGGGEPVILTVEQQARFKALGRKRTLYRILSGLFFIPALLFMTAAEARFENAKKAGDIAAAEKELRTMRKAAITAVVVGVPLLILYIALEL